MKNSEIVELSTEDLVAKIAEEKVALTKLKFAHAVSAIENPNRIKYTRKTIARLMTELTKRRKAEQAAAQTTTETAAEA
ncbi:large subunit ribosomal protein L29 [Parapedobacter composti]|uniref:Large ribosomal subunit protein uL29 n=1 Tax=Parapedobacter composti TaxID=623281 RepID=A0A1I1JDI5_9SPHI|nr:50S ribosomal protein L29 [Parapedobacter composti]SFC44688.1 large subunit ribosomal protein L29 [Parapedobacter composti]